MNQYKQISFLFLSVCLCILTGCKKFLAEKSDKNLSTINTLKDLRLLLDGDYDMGVDHHMTASDEYYLTEAEWTSTAEPHRLTYIWTGPLPYDHDWTRKYKNIFEMNTILANVDKVRADDLGAQREQIRATALFIRAFAFYQVATEYALQYDNADPGTGLGIPLRLDENYQTKSTRADLKTTYAQIINDLEEAAKQLPPTELYKTRPSKATAYALLARIYLQTGQYAKAKERADGCLGLSPALLNFNNLKETDAYPAGDPAKNPEILYYSMIEATSAAGKNRVVPSLLALYTEHDLRRKLFFGPKPDGTTQFRGSYTGRTALFTGLSTSEVYLIRGECYARLGDAAKAIDDLNTLLKARWKPSEFVALPAGTPEEALKTILTERRKELIFRGLRWADLKRLNREPAFQVTLTRQLGIKTYTLPPNDNRYAFLIPPDVINFSGMPQNPR